MIQRLPVPPVSVRKEVHRIFPWAERGYWTSLFGGRTNSIWQVTAPTLNSTAILKLYRSNAGHLKDVNPLFPNDPDSEAKLLRHLHAESFAPNLIAKFGTDHGECILYEAIPGVRWQAGVADVANLITKLHQIPAPTGIRRIANGSAELALQSKEIARRCRDRSALGEMPEDNDIPPSQNLSLVHGDIVPGNLIQNEAGLHLIDWQCPAIGDPCEDIAIFVSPAMQLLYRGTILSVQERRDFNQNLPTKLVARYQALAPLYHFRMAAYCLWQSENGRPDYLEGYQAEMAALHSLS